MSIISFVIEILFFSLLIYIGIIIGIKIDKKENENIFK